jgi:hypothetical protein
MKTVFSVEFSLRLYNEDSMPAEIELMESLEIAIVDDWEELAKKELGSEEKTSCVIQLQ